MKDLNDLFFLLKENPIILLPITFITVLFLNHYLSSKVLLVTKAKKLMTEVNDRSSHKTPVPPFGGVSFFLVLMLLFAGLIAVGLDATTGFLVIGISFIFISGIKDDLMASSAVMKLVTQFFGAALIIFLPELQFDTLHGAFGIKSMPEWGFVVFKLYCVLFIINSFNLIDGIDGLSSTIGIIVSASLLPIFWFSGNELLGVVCLGIIAMLISFMRFNFSSGKFKMFMGDGGSLTLGYVLSFLILRAASIGDALPFTESWLPNNVALFILVVFFLPTLDTFRVIVIRLREGRKVYVADRNHLHHVMIDAGLNHKQATVILGSVNIAFILAYLFFDQYLTNLGMNLVVISFYFLSVVVLRVIHTSTTMSKKEKTNWKAQLGMALRSFLP